MTIAAIIACRVGSKRMYKKPLMKIMNKTILELLIERLKTSKMINKIVLAIAEGDENKIFLEYAEKLGLGYVVGNEKDVLGRLIAGAERVGANTLVRVTSDCPLIFLENIDAIIKHHLDNQSDLTFTEKLPLGAFIEVLSLDALKRSHEYGEEKHRSELVTLYINENKDKFKIEIITPPKELQRPDIILTVDTPEDLRVMQQLYEKLQKPGRLITVKEAIQFFDENPKIRELNKDQDRKFARIWS